MYERESSGIQLLTGFVDTVGPTAATLLAPLAGTVHVAVASPTVLSVAVAAPALLGVLRTGKAIAQLSAPGAALLRRVVSGTESQLGEVTSGLVSEAAEETGCNV